jgi:phage head maturation protease
VLGLGLPRVFQLAQRQYRTFALRVEPSDEDDEDGAFPATISSDAPVPREGGYREILDHSPDAVNLSRQPLPLIESHDSSRLNVGIVDSLRLTGGKLRGVVRFGKSARARELAADVRARIIRGLSVGYQIDESTWDDDSTLRATRWTPLETSMVAVPADTNAGFYRSRTMADENVNSDEGLSRRQAAAQRRTAEAELEAAAAASTRAAEIANLAQRHGLSDRVAGWLTRGTTLQQVREEILAARATDPRTLTRPSTSDGIDRTETRALSVSDAPIPAEELRKYSLLRAIRSMVPGADARAEREAGFEREVSRELEQTCGRSSKGMLVPDEIFLGARHRAPRRILERALSTGTAPPAATWSHSICSPANLSRRSISSPRSSHSARGA